MFILSFLEQIQLRLIADDDLMTAVQCPDAGRVHFVRITEIDAMKVSAEEETDRIHRTVRHSARQAMRPVISARKPTASERSMAVVCMVYNGLLSRILYPPVK